LLRCVACGAGGKKGYMNLHAYTISSPDEAFIVVCCPRAYRHNTPSSLVFSFLAFENRQHKFFLTASAFFETKSKQNKRESKHHRRHQCSCGQCNGRGLDAGIDRWVPSPGKTASRASCRMKINLVHDEYH
jgi:hypothetical protein